MISLKPYPNLRRKVRHGEKLRTIVKQKNAYEHNAGDPYDCIFGKEPYTEHNIIIVPFYVSHDGYSVKLPKDHVYCNSPFCVRDINAGAVAWLFARDSSSRVAPGVSIHAGINPYEFFEKVDRINEMYPYLPDDE
jgi:hypothetical protein